MNKKTTKYLLKFVFSLIVCVFIGYMLVTITFHLNQGPDRRYDIGDGYELLSYKYGSWYLIYWKSKDEYDYVIHPEKINKFSFDGNWIFGETDKRWFVVNKKNHEIDYYDSKEKLKLGKNISVDRYQIITNPDQFEVIHSWTKKNVRIAKLWSLVILLTVPLLFTFWSNIRHYCFKSKRKIV